MKDVPLVKIKQRDNGETVLMLHREVSLKMLARMVAHVVRRSGEPDLLVLSDFVDYLDRELRGDLSALAQIAQMSAKPNLN